ncbi:cytochrome P450 [Dactylosporangium sp. AC04546]|uniref:cytochrome P450 n=1 Tax=Dactylosporangium sp. AC04546 TaxID=2862460 RepID=UPI001EDFD604|nr:cytochrome P450 [Dactylosporangium sp. AC04546]WVK86910.1 cytochrome P450 [Dactylosporangium sp. AC04546]
MTTDRPVIEFDHLSAEYAADPLGVYRGVRSRCPVAWTEAHGGYWVASAYSTVFAASRDDKTFSSKKGRHGDIDYTGVVIPSEPSLPLLPIEVDPPELHPFRKVLNPAFGPKAVARLAPEIERFTAWCVDQVIESGEIDFVEDLASPVPAVATLLLVGLPVTDWQRYSRAFHGLAANAPGSAEYTEALELIHSIAGMARSEIADRRLHPKDDLLTTLTQAEIGGRRLEDAQIASILTTTLGGGIDTTTALIANALVYLDKHPEHRTRLATDDAFMSSFCEEMLRYYSPVQGFARTVTKDTELGGCTLQRGDRVFLSWAAANHDPLAFEQPEEIVPDRFPNRHTSFGIGSHRCIGSTLARAEFAVVVREVLRRMPDYTLVDGAVPYSNIGTVNGWHRLPARFTRGRPVGATS